MAKTKKKDKRGLFRVSWLESRYAWRVKNGQDNLTLLSLQSDNTKAATYRGAIKNIKKTNKLNWDLLTIAKVEQYDYDNKTWDVVQELKPNPKNYRDYPASGPFRELF
jgi:hypothetical protein